MPRAGSTRPFWRRGNEGKPRPKDAPPDHRRKRDTPPEATEDVEARFVVPASMKAQIVAEKQARNCTISALLREIISQSLDVEERPRRRGQDERPDQHPTAVPDAGERTTILWAYMSPRLKRRLIEVTETHESMSAYVRGAVRDYFWARTMEGR